MSHRKLYQISKSRHGDLHRDVVHDMYVKFGQELPSMAYLSTCIKHAKPQPIQQRFELFDEVEDFSEEESIDKYSLIIKAMNNVRDKYELEIDTFLECNVNSTFKAFEERSGIARSVLEKICKFAKHEILNEYIRIKSLD